MDLRSPMLPVDAATSCVRGFGACLLVLVVASVTGCGEAPAPRPTAPRDLSGPPRWRAAATNVPEDGGAVVVHAPSGCVLRFSVVDPDGLVTKSLREVLPAGAQVRVAWSAREVETKALAVTPDDRRAGRSVPKTIALTYWREGGMVHTFALQRMTRPGLGATHFVWALPPTEFEPLPWSERVHLGALAISDWMEGTPLLQLRAGGPRWSGRAPTPDAGDREAVTRLVLEVTPTAD